MKKTFFLIFAFIIAVSALPAAADLLWTPSDDYFKRAEGWFSLDSCEVQDRQFYLAAGESGYVTAYKTPKDKTPIAAYPNGTEFRIPFICGRGNNLWGTIEAVRFAGQIAFTMDWSGTSGYIPLSDLVLSYDTEAFAANHKDEITPFDEESFDFCSVDEFVLWKTPDTRVEVEYVDHRYLSVICDRLQKIGGYYVDPEGNRWIEITVRKQTEHGWFSPDVLTENDIKPVY